MKQRTVLYYFTSYFPYGFAEQFIENEISELASKYDEVVVVSLHGLESTHDKKLASNVRVEKARMELAAIKEVSILTNIKIISAIVFSELSSENAFKRLFKLRSLLSQIRFALKLRAYILKISAQNSGSGISMSYYSTWMNEWALSMAILYQQKGIDKFTFKMRGFDLFDERRAEGYMPFRKFIFANSSCRLSMSHEGVSYLASKGYTNVFCNHPGINIYPKPEQDSNTVFTVLSCSNMIPLKRVTLIAESICKCAFNIKWIHFGDGADMEEVRRIVQNAPSNITVELKGRVLNSEIVQFYKSHKVDLFIHLSLSEGFGYSIIEAFSFGIPAVLFPGGAVKELIDKEYCLEVGENDTATEIASLILEAKNSFCADSDLKDQIISSCRRQFDIEIQGQQLYKFIEKAPHLG